MPTTPKRNQSKKNSSLTNDELGDRFERYLASRFGKKVAFSGGNWKCGGGDIRGQKDFRYFLGEAKATSFKSKSISLDVIDKIRLEALQEKKSWVLFLEISGRKFALLDLDEFDYMVKESVYNE